MEFFTEQQRIALKVQDIIDRAEEHHNKIDPVLIKQSHKATTFLQEVKRKNALKDKKTTLNMREAFEQNYAKFN